MRCSLMIVLAVATVASGQTKDDYDAAAALALMAKPMAVERARPLTLAEATKYMREHPGKPVLVRVGDLDCRPLCDKVRESMPACHADEMWSDKTPRMMLMCGDPMDPASVRIFREWKGVVPALDEVKREAKGVEEWSAKNRERKIELAPMPREIPTALNWRVVVPPPPIGVPVPCAT